VKSSRSSFFSCFVGLLIHARIGGKIDGKEQKMPLIEVHLLEGRTDEQKRAVLEAITKAVHESLGAPFPSIRVWIQEMGRKEYMVAGELATEIKK
jgi:4-oxalocrotonate tautomerase